MPEEKERHVRPFAEFLHMQRGGDLQREVSQALNEVVEAVHETGRAGAVTLVVSVKPIGKSAHRQLIVTDQVKIKKPEGDRGESIFFADDNHNLVRDNPNQPEIPGLREVPRPEARDLSGKDAAAGEGAGQ